MAAAPDRAVLARRSLPYAGRRAVAVLLAALVASCLALAGCGGGATSTATRAGTAAGTAGGGAAVASLAPSSPTSRLAVVTVDELPAEAVTTLRLIAAGGPFPYAKDGSTFGNRERLLPSRPSGFYREYTVTTPGSDDRGARRIVTGRDGTRFYTDDHYASFREVVQP